MDYINYRHIPTKGIYELRRTVAAMNTVLGDVLCPALIMQGDNDSVVDPDSADMIYRKIGSTDKQLQLIQSDRHGILNEDTEGAQDKVLEFLSRIQASHPIEHRREPLYPWETAYTGIGQWQGINIFDSPNHLIRVRKFIRREGASCPERRRFRAHLLGQRIPGLPG